MANENSRFVERLGGASSNLFAAREIKIIGSLPKTISKRLKGQK